MPPADQDRVREILPRVAVRFGWHQAAILDTDEIRNLTIPKGTLTGEEREVINHHMLRPSRCRAPAVSAPPQAGSELLVATTSAWTARATARAYPRTDVGAGSHHGHSRYF